MRPATHTATDARTNNDTANPHSRKTSRRLLFGRLFLYILDNLVGCLAVQMVFVWWSNKMGGRKMGTASLAPLKAVQWVARRVFGSWSSQQTSRAESTDRTARNALNDIQLARLSGGRRRRFDHNIWKNIRHNGINEWFQHTIEDSTTEKRGFSFLKPSKNDHRNFNNDALGISIPSLLESLCSQSTTAPDQPYYHTASHSNLEPSVSSA